MAARAQDNAQHLLVESKWEEMKRAESHQNGPHGWDKTQDRTRDRRPEPSCHRQTGNQTGNENKHWTRPVDWTKLDTRRNPRQDTRTMDLKGLPPYDPLLSGLPPIPDAPVDGEFLMERYGLSKAAFHNRKNSLPSIKGIRHGKRVYFPPQEVWLMDACHWYLKSGYSLTEILQAQEGYQAPATPEGNDDEGTIEVTPIGKAPEGAGTLAVSPQAAQLSKDLGNLILQAVQAVAPKAQSDPLRTHRLLEEAAEKEYILTNKMLADTLEFKPETVRGFKSVEHRHGFELTKIGAGKWKVRRMTKAELKAEMAAEAA